MDLLEGLGRMFYIADPSKTSFPDLASLPKKGYVQEAIPYFFFMIVVEWSVLIMKGKYPALSDGLLSIVHGHIGWIHQM